MYIRISEHVKKWETLYGGSLPMSTPELDEIDGLVDVKDHDAARVIGRLAAEVRRLREARR